MAVLDVPVNPYLSRLPEKIDEAIWWALGQEPPRPYIGVSVLGEPCGRKLWLSFRWFITREVFPGRMLRLFRRGHREEETIVSDLRLAGVEISHVLDDQLTFDFGCHVMGHPDGFITKGVPEAPSTGHIAEFKTHNDASFRELKSKGVKEAKPMHWIQMQCGMVGASRYFGHKIDRALYVAVNKNDDELYIERVRLDEMAAENAIQRGQRIAVSDYLPPGISQRPDWWQCKLCAYHSFCHKEGKEKMLPEINCRTCCHFTAAKDGKCYCEIFDHSEIPLEAQLEEHYCHVFHPDMVGWPYVEKLSTKDSVAYSIDQLGGDVVLNGMDGYSSREIATAIEGGATSAAGIERIPEEDTEITF